VDVAAALRGGWTVGSKAVSWTYALCSLAVIAVYPWLTEAGRLAAFRLIAFATIPAVVLGARAYGGGGRWPIWLVLLLSGLILVNLGNLVKLYPTEPTTTAAGAIDAIGNLVLFGAAVSVVVKTGPSDFGGIIDASVVGLAVGGLLWNFVLLPSEQRGHIPVSSEVDAFLVVFALAGAMGALVRLANTTGGRFSPLWYLGAAILLAIAGNAVFPLVGDSWLRSASLMLFMAAYMCVGLFGLDPSAYQLFGKRAVYREHLSGGRVWFLGAAVAVIPVASGISELVGGRVNGTLLVAGGGLVTALVMVRVRRLVYERERAERALNHLASHDELTGLVNRRVFVDVLGDELSRSRRCVILFCDLNGFKPVNDRLGHAAGDQLLIEVARRMETSVRQSDVVARFGGDEFVALLKDAQPADVDGILDRVSAGLSQPVPLPSESVTVGASIGTAISTPGEEPEGLLKRADLAMYRAKRSGSRESLVRIASA